MNALAFALRGLWHFRKAHAGVLAGSALGAMVLLGALTAGDSVRETLRAGAAARTGKVDAVLAGGDRFFRAALADDVAGGDIRTAPVLMLRGTATVQQSGRSLGGVRVVGVDHRFAGFSPGGGFTGPTGREFHANRHLASQLDLGGGEALVLRFEKPSMVAADAPLTGKTGDLLALGGTVSRICGENEFGRFSLENTQLPQATVFVPLDRLQELAGLDGRANLMLINGIAAASPDRLAARIGLSCTLDDYGISVVEVPLAKAMEIRSRRVFFDRPVADAIQARIPQATPVITYMANTLAANGRETPYSMVTAVDPDAAGFITSGGKGVVVNDWLASDLGLSAGDEVRMDYYSVDAGNRLIGKSASFRVDAVVPLAGLAADRMWMPDFPGVAEAESTSDWDAGVPIDMKRIREKDETYWDDHRGTPKMFLPLEAGRGLFANRWGEFTALRVSGMDAEALTQSLLEALDPATTGLLVRNIRAEGMAAAKSPVDFGGLFLGMSLFLMLSAVALTAMMFRFQVESRDRESGVLAALGIPPATILRWRLIEGFLVVSAGSLAGAVLSLGYTTVLLGFLGKIWRDTGGGVFRFLISWLTMVSGIGGFVLLMMLVIWRVTRVRSRRSASLRVEAGASGDVVGRTSRGFPWISIGLAVAGLAVPAAGRWLGTPGAFFLGGFFWLLAGLGFCRRMLSRQPSGVMSCLSPGGLAAINSARRTSRGMVVVACLACGVFMVIAVAAFRKHQGDDWQERTSGAGGFAYWVETSSSAPRAGPGLEDPLGLGESQRDFGAVLSLRQGPGDEASCFNLNRVDRPRLLAADSAKLSQLGAFSIKSVKDGLPKDWSVLRDGPVLRAFVDETTLLWVLKRKLGDRLIYQDERGVDLPVEIVGTLADSIFQGNLIVDDSRLLRHFPSSAGARVFLVEAKGHPDPALLRGVLGDRGAVVDTTRARLAAFHEVENTYIAVFHLLGGLGVVLGSAGLGLLTARNLRERAGEFAILHSLGVPVRVVRRVITLESARWIRWGLGVGVVAALMPLAAAPPSGGLWTTAGWLALLVLLIAANAGFWSWLAMRGTLGKSPAQAEADGE